jgi:predicted RNA-binding protein YlqC (UPF0109 family)
MNNSIDQQFVEFVVKSLVGNPDAVQVERRIDEKGVLLELTVDPEDLGRVIGKRGATAQSLRTLLRALGTKNEARYNLKIVDNGEPRPPRDDDAPVASKRDDHATRADDQLADDSSQTTDDQASVTKPLDDDLDDDDTSVSDKDVRESDVVSRTRKELADLDDLDV